MRVRFGGLQNPAYGTAYFLNFNFYETYLLPFVFFLLSFFFTFCSESLCRAELSMAKPAKGERSENQKHYAGNNERRQFQSRETDDAAI